MMPKTSKLSGRRRQAKTSRSKPHASTPVISSDSSRSSPVQAEACSRLKPEHMHAYIEYVHILRDIVMRIERPKWERIKALRSATKEKIRERVVSLMY